MKIKLYPDIVTSLIEESKIFYTELLDFGVTFENDFYLILHTPNKQAEISFLRPDHPSQQPLFQDAFQGKGIFLTMEVQNVEHTYEALKEKDAEIKVKLCDEPWGDRHFAIEDPNGAGIDIVEYHQS